jgi:tripartite-type tricarboxylate transporter receptor subunit TctC
MSKNLIKKTSWTGGFLLIMYFFSFGSEIFAADYPKSPITMVIQMAAGGTSDIVARTLGERVSQDLGQPIIPINKVGGGGTIGVNEMIRSKPDGYTFGCISLPTVAVIPHIRNLPYNPLKDISHICCLLPYDMGLVTRADAPWKSFEDLVEYSKKNPGKISYGSPGPGTINHLQGSVLTKNYNLEWKHVPFKGMSEGTTALLGGHIDVEITPPAEVVQHIKTGKLRLLIATTKYRWLDFPDVPTILEKGQKIALTSYLSLGAPAGTPEPIRQKLEGSFKKWLHDDNIKKDFEKRFSTRLIYVSGEEYGKFVAEQFSFYGNLLKSLGMTK